MKTYTFTLIISKPSVDEETAANKLYEAGCDDALFSVINGVCYVAFDRKAKSYEQAFRSACDDIFNAKIGSYVKNVTH